jgi:hypothetical protein
MQIVLCDIWQLWRLIDCSYPDGYDLYRNVEPVSRWEFVFGCSDRKKFDELVNEFRIGRTAGNCIYRTARTMNNQIVDKGETFLGLKNKLPNQLL